MSEYFLADHKAEERARQREKQPENRQSAKAETIKVTLLGDFMFPSAEPQGCDPYNNTQGKPVRDAWRARRDRR
jgi:hypothetical protein